MDSLLKNSQNIIVEKLTIINCGGNESDLFTEQAVFDFFNVTNLLFQKNSMQYMAGYGLQAVDCSYVSSSTTALTDSFDNLSNPPLGLTRTWCSG